MSVGYKHGAYAEIISSPGSLYATAVGTLPVYIGCAPVHQLRDYASKVIQPLMVTDLNSARSQLGLMTTNWAGFELCEAFDAHFNSKINPIGPIVVINVFNPSAHKTAAETTVDIPFVQKVGYLNDSKVILNTVSIVDMAFGTDFEASYTDDGQRVMITLKAEAESLQVKYTAADPSKVTADEVISGGIEALKLVYQKYNRVPTLICAPKWSGVKVVHDALLEAIASINGHWMTYLMSDLPEAADIAAAIAVKDTQGYTSAKETPCWPYAKKGSNIYHLSTIATVTAQYVDYVNEDVPFETPSNKPIDIDGLCKADGTPLDFDQTKANELNAAGIRTASYWDGHFVLWGAHTGAYVYMMDVKPEEIYDCSMRMLQYIANTFQRRYGLKVDQPMNRAAIDTILNDYQAFLDNLSAQGALLGATIDFLETSNRLSDMVEGDFVFDIETTTTPPGKSLTAKIRYSTSGISTLFGGESA